MWVPSPCALVVPPHVKLTMKHESGCDIAGFHVGKLAGRPQHIQFPRGDPLHCETLGPQLVSDSESRLVVNNSLMARTNPMLKTISEPISIIFRQV